jgi:D-serine dehydratase
LINPQYSKFEESIKNISLSEDDVFDAENRLNRFAPYPVADTLSTFTPA